MAQTSEAPMTLEDVRARVVEAASMHIVFDGISEEALRASIQEAGVDPDLARVAFPKGPIDLAVAFHIAGDAALADQLAEEDLGHLRYSERVAHAVMARLLIAARDKETVRRAAGFFALPMNAAQGSKCIWNTADTIWSALGDTSDDLNWYSKRMILSGVYSASLLYWLGDESEGYVNTKTFVDRRIANVMQFEKTKANVKSWRIYDAFRKGPGRFLDRIKAPRGSGMNDLPGQWRNQE